MASTGQAQAMHDASGRAGVAFARTSQRPEPAIMIPGIAADGSLFPIEKLAAHHGDGVLHLAISVFVFSGDLLLIQRRALGKYHCGGQWANTCCTHPHWQESLEASARRRLIEELGLFLPLQRTAVVDYRAEVAADMTEHERVHVYRAETNHGALHISPNPDEVSETRWATRQDLQQEALERPQDFAPWFRIYLRRWQELGI